MTIRIHDIEEIDVAALPKYQLTAQQAFDLVWNGILEQGSAALSGFALNTPEVPMLRTSIGLKDSLGHLIPDTLYEPHMEHVAVYAVTRLTGLPRSYIDDLRSAHDGPAIFYPSTFHSEFIKRMKETATKWKLTLPDIPATSNVSLTSLFWEKFRNAFAEA